MYTFDKVQNLLLPDVEVLFRFLLLICTNSILKTKQMASVKLTEVVSEENAFSTIFCRVDEGVG